MFKTTKLLLRRIDPGTVVIGGVKPVSFSKPHYIGVYEVTQKQYESMAGVNPSKFKGEMRPVGGVNYFDIRGHQKGARWPLDKAAFRNARLSVRIYRMRGDCMTCMVISMNGVLNGDDDFPPQYCRGAAKMRRMPPPRQRQLTAVT